MDEKTIIEGCKKKNNLCRKEFYELFAGKMLAICYRYLGNMENAKDVMHDAFIIAFNSMDKFTYMGEGSAFAWLKKIMVNTSLSHLKKRKRIQFVDIEDYAANNEPEAHDENTPDTVPPDILSEMISRLPDGYRTVLNLYAFEGKSHKEIAGILNIKLNSSTSQLIRARKLLSKWIDDYHQNKKHE